MTRHAQRTLLFASLIAGLFEFATAAFIEVPAAAATFGVIYLAGCVWLVRGRGVGAPILLALTNLVELAGEPFYQRETTSDWIFQLGFGGLCLVGLAAAVLVVAQLRRRRMLPATHAARA